MVLIGDRVQAMATVQLMTLPTATIKRQPEDFVVEELPAYEPSGTGEHLFVTFTKRDLNTLDAVRRLADALGVDARGAGYAGMKDRRAITTQRASFPWPLARDADRACSTLALEGVTVLGWKRHGHKLKPGHLAGNRFTITLRDLAPERIEEMTMGLLRLAREGVPNAFGTQRFGKNADNALFAARWLRGEVDPPRDRRMQRMLFSAWQSELFNRLLAVRRADGTWCSVLPGDLAKKHDSGGLFQVPDSGPELDEARERAAESAISATGPMFGHKMRWPGGVPGEMERRTLTDALPDTGRLFELRKLGEGTRRPLRQWLREPSSHPNPAQGSLTLTFVLPKGGYATTVLAEICAIQAADRA